MQPVKKMRLSRFMLASWVNAKSCQNDCFASKDDYMNGKYQQFLINPSCYLEGYEGSRQDKESDFDFKASSSDCVDVFR